MTNQSIASVTTAYNAMRSLPRQIEALYQQTLPLGEIIVVDNASTDGTSEMLAERYAQVTVLRMSSNLGAAGAWAAGLSYAALKKGHDWVWTFDDDSIPPKDALEKMLAGMNSVNPVQDKIGMIVPMPIHRETRTCYPPLLWRDGFVMPSAAQARETFWFADLAIASGSLLRREVVVQIGLPRADFFMDMFDFEYSLRIRASGYRIMVMGQLEMSHEIGNLRKIDFLGFKHSWIDQAPFREYYFSRNLTYLAWHLYANRSTKKSAVRYLALRGIHVILFGTKKMKSLIRITQGLNDGLRGKLGVRFLPGARTLL